MKCCIVGIGKHSSENLIPALQRLQNENLITIKYLCRENVEKGDGGLNVPVISRFPLDVDFMVVCGHPELHCKAIEFSNTTKIPIFVEKPHLIESRYVNERVMIGYNYNFVPLPEQIDHIMCGTKGIYRSWPDLFSNEDERYYHIFHSILVHPISLIVQRHGKPSSVQVTNMSGQEDVILDIKLLYSDKTRTIHFSSTCDSFRLDVTTGDKTVECKPWKADSYYNMLKYYVESRFVPLVNNAHTGEDVLFVIDALVQNVC